MAKHVRKYQMRPIPREISETGGYSAQFLQGEEGTVDAYDEVMPGTIEKSGVKVSADVGKILTKQFLLDCVAYVARTGKTLIVAGVFVIRLAIRGSYRNKDSQVKASNVRISVYLLNEARPLFTFTLSNALEGKTLLLTSATTPGSPYKHVVQGGEVLINGQYTMILEGDKVTASVKGTDGMTFAAECEVLESDDSHILVQMPADFNDPALVGKEITFTVESRCGDPDAGTQTKSTTATLDKGEVAPPEPEVTDVASEGHEGEIVIGTPFAAIGSGLDAFDPETGSVKVKWSQGGVAKDAEIEPAEVTATKMSFAFPDALVGVPVDTELTFEITFDETVKTKGSKLVEE